MNSAENASKSEEPETEGLKELNESAKRRLVALITLDHVIIPELNREYVLPEMKAHYLYIVEHFSINDPDDFQFPPDLETYRDYPLLNDDTYTVSDYNKLSKQYLEPRMRKQKYLKDLDASGILIVMIMSSKYVVLR